MTATFRIRNDRLYVSGVTPGSHKDAIAKWEFLHNCAVDGLFVSDGGSTTCSFCLAHCDSDEGDDCFGCPIYETTGKFDCRDTPYEEYWQAVRCWDIDRAIEASASMVEFLKGLEEE